MRKEVRAMMNIDHLNYRGFDTRTFAEIFPSDTDFADYYDGCGFPKRLLTGTIDGIDYSKYDIKAIYALLISNFANSHILAYDENRFALKVMQIIYDAGPIWQKAMGVQEKLLDMAADDILQGSKSVYRHDGKWTKGNRQLQNRAQHPDSEPGSGDSVTPTEPTHEDPDMDYPTFPAELTYVSDQTTHYDKGISTVGEDNTATWTKDNIKAWNEFLMTLDDSISERFIDKFRGLFQVVIWPNRPPLMYRTEADYD